MLIRKMISEDSLQVATIHTLSWQKAYKGIVSQTYLNSLSIESREQNWKKGIELNQPSIVRLVAEEKNKIVGFVCGFDNRTLSLVPSSDSELWAIYVHPDHVRAAIGFKLIKAFMSELKEIGKKKMCVWCLEENTIGRSFYKKNGGLLSSAIQKIKIAELPLVEVAYEFEL